MSSAQTKEREEEGLGRYHKGGFHPVRLGEVYNSKYKVLRKLGFGRYSTVWLVKSQDNQRLSAMKVLSAECYGTDNDIFELEILQHLRNSRKEHQGYQYISALQDSFTHEGPNGYHVCLIFKVMAESLSTFRCWFEDQQMPSPLVQRLTTQLLQALDFAHSCGVIHTDIQPGNIMIQLPDESVIDDYMERKSVDTQNSDDPTSSVIVSTQGLRDFYFDEGFDMMTLDIALSDWGVASWQDKHLTEMIQPVLLRAPEVILKAQWGPAVDIWNLGALVPEFLYAQRMFSGRNRTGIYSTQVHLEEMDKLSGPFLSALLADASVLKDPFDDDGHVKDAELDTFVGLEQRVSSMEIVERAKFIAFINSMLVLDPEMRKTARELLDEPWLKHEYEDDIVVET